jgi:hypothetical protein
MKLFLRVGEERNPDKRNDDVGVGGKEKEKRSFDNLFNEKGGLK